MTTNTPISRRAAELQALEIQVLRGWEIFRSQNLTHADCIRMLIGWTKSKHNSTCKKCGRNGIRPPESLRFTTCTFCHKKHWYTAQTYFRRIHNVFAWAGTIFLFEQGIIPSAAALARVANIAGSSAQAILKTLSKLILSRMPNVEIHCSNLAPVVGRRSTETPARSSTKSEQEHLEELTNQVSASAEASDFFGVIGLEIEEPSNDNSNCLTESKSQLESADTCPQILPFHKKSLATNDGGSTQPVTDSPRLAKEDDLVLSLISSNPISFDQLFARTNLPVGQLSASLLNLELANLAVRLDGDYYVKRNSFAAKGQEPSTNAGSGSREAGKIEAISKAIYFVKSRFQAISLKYLQLYLAACWCAQDRKRWGNEALLSECQRSNRPKLSEIFEFVSPPFVKLAPIPSN